MHIHPDIVKGRCGLAPEGAGAKRHFLHGVQERVIGDGMTDIARIIEIVEPEVKALGFDLVRVRLYGKSEVGDEEHTLQIMAERPETGQLVIEDCAALSHRISDKIDALEEAGEMLIEEAYRLEVSSPGIDRPLTRPKDFAAWIGHEARVELAELLDNRKRFRGDLVAFDEAAGVISIEDDGAVFAVPFALVTNAKLILTDKLIAASRPVDASGVDEEDFEDEDVSAQSAAFLEEQED